MFVSFSFLDGTLQLPETNLAFAISATGLEAEETYAFMKDIINWIIDKYGTERLEYSVIIYGGSASTQVTFGEIFESDAELIKAVGSMSRISGAPSLGKALDAAKDQFESPLIRLNAAKVIRACYYYFKLKRILCVDLMLESSPIKREAMRNPRLVSYLRQAYSIIYENVLVENFVSLYQESYNTQATETRKEESGGNF